MRPGAAALQVKERAIEGDAGACGKGADVIRLRVGRDEGSGGDRIGTVQIRRADLRFDATDEPGDLIIEAKLPTGEPAVPIVTAGRGRTTEAEGGDVVRAARGVPILAEKIAAGMNTDVEAGPAEGSVSRDLVDRAGDRKIGGKRLAIERPAMEQARRRQSDCCE